MKSYTFRTATSISVLMLSLILSSYDYEKFLGRWGYIQVTNPITQQLEQQVNPGVFTIEVKASDDVTSYFGTAFNEIQTAASNWNNANGHLQISVVNGGNIQYTAQGNWQNEIFEDKYGAEIDPNSRAIIAGVKPKVIYNTSASYCGGNPIEFGELDILLHKHDLVNLKWVKKYTMSTGNCIETDLFTVILHEFGHFIGLGHAKGLTASAGSCMLPGLNFCDIRVLKPDDIQAAYDLYNPGVDGKGIIACDKFATDFSVVNIRCRSYDTYITEAIQQAGSNCKNEGCKSECRAFYQNDEGSLVIISYEGSCKKSAFDFNNNFGLSYNAISGINTFIADTVPLNYKRYMRLIYAFGENSQEFNQFFVGYEDHIMNDGLNDGDYPGYGDLFDLCDKFIAEFSPLIDATYRCEHNLTNPEILLNQNQINLASNILDEIISMGPNPNLMNEAVFIKSKLPNFLGSNIKDAYKLYFALNDPAL